MRNTRACESEINNIKRVMVENERKSAEKIHKLQLKIRLLVEENGKLKEASSGPILNLSKSTFGYFSG